MPGTVIPRFTPLACGAVADGVTKDTGAFQKAIDACAAAGGGMVYVPPGKYLIGPVYLRSHTNLHLSAGAVLLGSREKRDYRIVTRRYSGKVGRTIEALINGDGMSGGFLHGLGEAPIEDVLFDSVRIQADRPLTCRHVKALDIRHLRIDVSIGPELTLQDARDVVIERFIASGARSTGPALRLERVRDAVIAGCVAPHAGLDPVERIDCTNVRCAGDTRKE